MIPDSKPYVPDWRKALKAANAAPRCGAKKRRKKTPCGSPAMANGRCRIHGGLSTGPKTVEGIENIRKAQAKHGQNYAQSNGTSIVPVSGLSLQPSTGSDKFLRSSHSRLASNSVV